MFGLFGCVNARCSTGTAGEFAGVGYWGEMLHSSASFVADYPGELHVVPPVELTAVIRREP